MNMNDQLKNEPKKLPEHVKTVSILNNGNSIITVDDHCYVIRNWTGQEWVSTPWIFKEALNILKDLPDNPDESERVEEPNENHLRIVQ
jgi:hypothetical protein